MNFIALLKKEQQLLSNLKNYIYYLPAFYLILLFGCSESKIENPIDSLTQKLNNPEEALLFLNSKLSAPVDYAVLGNYENIDTPQLIGIEEVMTKKEWGIKFSGYNFTVDTVLVAFKTELYEGAIKGSKIQNIKVDSAGSDLLFYSSQDYFLGSGGGEIFAYIVDVKEKSVYYAHLFFLRNKAPQLFLSPNITDIRIRDYFTSAFKNDYNELIVVDKDFRLP